ncbi:MAG: carotenoid biosynthesis protein [Bacteroidales bacterium]|jgi:putative membrane protein|nr:carotenoid biosynthesis protein [Bacteroidales bacterium]MDD4671842.1 carotenoid biosynthesis protein [Bacteroidales bacterium]MDY0348847.1 carotenoid biosynthesis protein [Tenuifilaceae bacterium]
MISNNRFLNFFLTKQVTITLLFVIFYSVGVVGMLLPTTADYFLQLTPFALILSFTVLALSDESENRKKLVTYLLFIYVSSFAVEVAGVYTGALFGKYSYGDNLGIKLWGTPLIIGANWFFLVYTTAAIFEKVRVAPALKVLLASTSMLIYDIVMEQVAPKLDMWDWKHPSVPFQNYFTWFLIALIFHIGLRWLKIHIKNKLALAILLCQFIFFVLLFIFMD